MEDMVVIVLVEDAQAGSFGTRELLQGVVVVYLALRHIFFRERNVKISVEVVAEGRDPIKMPAHAFLECFDFGQRRAGDHYHCDVTRCEVRNGAIEMVGHEGATRAALLPIRSEHEVVDNQLAASGEEVSKCDP